MRAGLCLLAAATLLAGCGDGGERLSSTDLPNSAARLHVSSKAFTQGSRLPKRYTCDGAGDEPPVFASALPANTGELAVVVSDPDAPGGTFVHLTRYGISPRGSGEVSEGGQEGLNSTGESGWTPPCPPKGDEAHRYVWSVYALRDASGLDAGAKPDEVAAKLDHGVLASGTITARYGR
jgi:Raf kinase inhibitor-like YbhB/YbcL family protein